MTDIITAGDIRWGMGERHNNALPSVSAVYTGLPKGYCTGCMVRNSESPAFYGDSIGAFVHEVKWSEWQPSSAADLDDTAVADAVAALDWARDNGKRVRLRLFTGIWMPSWAYPTAGGMDWYEYAAATGESYKGKVPIWWEEGYRALYNDFNDLLRSAIGTHEALYEVTNSACSTVFAEPMNRQWSSANNVATAAAAGYTVAADIAAMKQAFVDMQAWGDIGVATYSAFNPWQEPRYLDTTLAGGATANPAVSFDLLDAFFHSLGRCAVFANNSIGAPIESRGPRYAALWGYMSTAATRDYPFRQPLGFQTMNKRVMTSFGTTAYETGSMCADLGACSVEMPEGWLSDPVIGMTTTQADELNTRFAENALLAGTL